MRRTLPGPRAARSGPRRDGPHGERRPRAGGLWSPAARRRRRPPRPGPGKCGPPSAAVRAAPPRPDRPAPTPPTRRRAASPACSWPFASSWWPRSPASQPSSTCSAAFRGLSDASISALILASPAPSPTRAAAPARPARPASRTPTPPAGRTTPPSWPWRPARWVAVVSAAVPLSSPWVEGIMTIRRKLPRKEPYKMNLLRSSFCMTSFSRRRT